MENVDKKNIGLPSRYINALYELCDEAKNLKKITLIIYQEYTMLILKKIMII